MASAARGKAVARRENDWASQTAASTSRRLVVPSPVPSSGHEESDEERVSTDSNESDSDASDCSSGDSGTGGLNDKDTFTDDQQSEEDDERSLEEEEEEEEEEDEGEECEEMSEESETELEVAAGGYPGFKDNRKKSNTKPSPSSASNASTGYKQKLIWDFVWAVDLRKDMQVSDTEIEKIMKRQMAMAGNHVKIETSSEGLGMEGKQTLAGWKLRRVSLLFHVARMNGSNVYFFYNRKHSCNVNRQTRIHIIVLSTISAGVRCR